MNEKRLVPKKRFKEFQNIDTWEQRSLGEDITLIGGATPLKANPNYWNGPIIWLSSQEIKKRYVSKGTHTITNKAVEDKTTRVVKAGTPLIVSRSGILVRMFPISIPIFDVAINQDIKALIFDEYTIYTPFLVAQLQKNEAFILKSIIKTGTTVQSISMPDFVKLQLFYPTKKEQEKIGVFFECLEDNIALYQRKLDKTKALKSAYLAEMFPGEGEKVPKRRFEGFSERWEQRKLDEVYNSVEGGNRLPKNMLSEGLIPYVIAKTTGNGILMRIDENTRDYHGNKMKMFPSGSITFSIDNPEAIFLQKESFYTSNIMRVLYMEEYNFNHSIFILESLKKLTKNYNWSLKFSGPVVMNSLISLPINKQGKVDWLEIEKIGKLINSYDDLIILYRSKIEKLKAIKQAYLQEMFV